jgi:hypothetical protein
MKKTETIKTPEGKTTISDEKKVETSGKNRGQYLSPAPETAEKPS